MSAPHPLDDTPASWQQQEDALARLHDAARREASPRAFFQRFVAAVSDCWGESVAVAVWLTAGRAVELVASHPRLAEQRPELSERRQQAAAMLVQGTEARDRPSGWHPIAAALPAAESSATPPGATWGVVEVQFSAAVGAEVRDAATDFVVAAAAAATDFHAYLQLQQQAASSHGQRRSERLLEQLQTDNRLTPLAYIAVNEGRPLLGCDRLTLAVRQGRGFRILAASGSDHVERRTPFARRAEDLATRVAAWGEPLAVGESATPEELPPPLAEAAAAYLDQSHARSMAAAPVTSPAEGGESGASDDDAVLPCEAVFIAEWFGTAAPMVAAETAELAHLCRGALARAVAIDRPILRRLVDRAQRRAGARRRAVPRWLLAAVALAGVTTALALIPARWEAAAPATLLPVNRHDVFAPATGRVVDVLVAHGDDVAAGAMLAIIDDPQLELRWQQVNGELAAVSRRIEALAVARTDRSVREQPDADALPPGAEQLQLIQQQASLQRQRELLARCREELTVVSPADGVVLTRDVQSLLASRPVERGQKLLTIADPHGPWELLAEVDQRDMGRVVTARGQLGPERPVRFRLAGDVDRVRTGQVVAIDAAAALDASQLDEPPPPVAVHVAVDAAALDDSPRPGLAAEVRIDCGERSLGYVWFHDLAAGIYRWWSF